ncbi:hypothetical protein NC651_004129 [Populus alba x Populus x berolinensis]|nr:hypothetical protein NC651_004129 [Populus alba x Populus x berolinensis]
MAGCSGACVAGKGKWSCCLGEGERPWLRGEDLGGEGWLEKEMARRGNG